MGVVRVRLRDGVGPGRAANHAAIFVVGRGKDTYLWIGNDAPGDMMCFATVAGRLTLRGLAKKILERVR